MVLRPLPELFPSNRPASMQLSSIAQELRQLASDIRVLRDMPPAKRAQHWRRPLDKAGELLRQAVSQGALDEDARHIVQCISTEELAHRPKVVYMELAEHWLKCRDNEMPEHQGHDTQKSGQDELPGKAKAMHVDVAVRCEALAKSLDRFAIAIDKATR